MAERRDEIFITDRGGRTWNLSELRSSVLWNRFYIVALFAILFLHLAWVVLKGGG